MLSITLITHYNNNNNSHNPASKKIYKNKKLNMQQIS